MINETLGKMISDYQTIILIGPNHFNSGRENIQTSNLDWKTKFGNLSADQSLIKTLIENKYADLNTDNFNSEHSVCGLVSFLKIHFPESKVIPLILKANVSKKEAKNLGQFLAQNCQDCLLLASIDFSHEVSPQQAQINDAKSIKILEKLDEESLDQITSDSLPSLQVLFSYLQESSKGRSASGRKGELITNSNSNQISLQNLPTVTSYITFTY